MFTAFMYYNSGEMEFFGILYGLVVRGFEMTLVPK